MAIVDVFTYNGERDLLRMHLNILDPLVDRFIICESKLTFSGYKKPLYFSEHEHFFKKFWKKINYYIIPDTFSFAESEKALLSPNTQGATHWVTEFLQKETILKALEYYSVQPGDTVYIGDVDEIWQPYEGEMPKKLKLRVYSYRLNNRSNEEFWGTYVAPFGYLQGKTLNHERSRTDIRTENYYGWHFTSMGGENEVRRKLNDSYTTETYNSLLNQAMLHERMEKNKDYIGRDFTFTNDVAEWPDYLRKNMYRYRKMLRR